MMHGNCGYPHMAREATALPICVARDFVMGGLLRCACHTYLFGSRVCLRQSLPRESALLPHGVALLRQLQPARVQLRLPPHAA